MIVEEYLRAIVKLRGPVEQMYSIEEYVLLHGRLWIPQYLPRKYKRGVPKYCFHNAQVLARQGLRYVEGFAVPACIPMPLHHAWCVDRNGKVIDITWEDGVEYFGICFETKTIREQLKGNKDSCSVLDNWEKRFPLLWKK